MNKSGLSLAGSTRSEQAGEGGEGGAGVRGGGSLSAPHLPNKETISLFKDSTRLSFNTCYSGAGRAVRLHIPLRISARRDFKTRRFREGGGGGPPERDYSELLRRCDRAAFKEERRREFPRAAAGSAPRSCFTRRDDTQDTFGPSHV